MRKKVQEIVRIEKKSTRCDRCDNWTSGEGETIRDINGRYLHNGWKIADRFEHQGEMYLILEKHVKKRRMILIGKRKVFYSWHTGKSVMKKVTPKDIHATIGYNNS